MLILAILKAVLGVFSLMAVWLGIQEYVRKRARLGPQVDVLQHMTHDCGSCHHAGLCSGEQEVQSHSPRTPRPANELIGISTGRRKENQ